MGQGLRQEPVRRGNHGGHAVGARWGWVLSDLKSALLSLDIKPNTIIFFDRRAIDERRLPEIELDLDYAPLCIPVHVPNGKTLHECIALYNGTVYEQGFKDGKEAENLQHGGY